MDNYYMAIQELNSWGEDEQFYRGYYYAQKKGKQEIYLQLADEQEERIEFVTDPENIHAHETEDMFFQKERNISIIKHPRYFPFFYHSHGFFEIVYVLSGNCIQSIGEDTLKLQEGDYCMIAPGVRHGIQVFDDNSIVVNILIRRSTFMDIFFNTIRNKSHIAMFFIGSLYKKNRIEYLMFRTYQDETIRNYVLEMYMEQICLDDYSDRIMCSILTIFFNQLTRKHGKTVEMKNGSKQYNSYQEEMMNYIMNNYESVSLRSLAEHFHFSEPYCSKLIKEISGMPFSELLTSIRMQQGENLLAQTQLSVENISDRVGYKNPESFIRAFKRRYHASPSQYREHPDLYTTKLISSTQKLKK